MPHRRSCISADHTGLHLRPFVHEWMVAPDGYVEDQSRAYPVSLFVKGHSYKMFGLFDASLHLFGTTEPGKILLFGTDGFGRDEFSRILYGGQTSVAAGIVATLIALMVGSILGMIAGYYGRWLDEAVMGATELFLSLPWLYFLLGVRAFLPLHLSPLRTFFLLTCVSRTDWLGKTGSSDPRTRSQPSKSELCSGREPALSGY